VSGSIRRGDRFSGKPQADVCLTPTLLCRHFSANTPCYALVLRRGNSYNGIMSLPMVFDYEAVKEIIKQYVSEVKTVFPVDKVYLYGSYANRTA
jgi:hypothetical protein